MGRTTSSLIDTLKLRFWPRLRTWTKGSRIIPWFIMLVSLHHTTAPAWAWPFLLEQSPEIDDLTDLGLWLWKGLAVAIFEDMIFCIPCTILCIRVLIEDISNWDCSVLASKAANCSSACATFTVALLSTGLLGGVRLRSGYRYDECCLPMLICSFNFVHCGDNNLIHFCSINHLFEYCGKAS